MGRLCSWCGAYLSAALESNRDVSHVLCTGCLEELREGLEATGMRMRDRGPGTDT